MLLFILTLISGLMYFCMDDMRAIRSVVNTLQIPSLESRVRYQSIDFPAGTYGTQGNHSRHVL